MKTTNPIFRLCALWLIILLSHNAAVSQEINSLTSGYNNPTLPRLTKQDTVHIFRLINIAREMDPGSDSTVKLFDNVLEQSVKLDFPDGAGLAYIGLASCAVNHHNNDLGLELLRKALPFCERATYRK
ncbi:MAG: hypothetical protein ACTHJ0_04900, partial [Flavipsychrobacter sp.]